MIIDFFDGRQKKDDNQQPVDKDKPMYTKSVSASLQDAKFRNAYAYQIKALKGSHTAVMPGRYMLI